jgi:DNA polymerase III subunit epsilon
VPRLRVTSGPGPPGTITAGPLRSRAQAEAAAGAARAAFGLRVCRPRLPVDDGTCLAGIIGSCHAPCRGGEHLDRYADAVEEARLWLEAPAGGAPARHLDERMRRLSAEHRFEDAAAVRDQLAALRTAGRAVERLRRARSRSGVILAPDTDDRFVQAFACAGGRVVARRRLPRAGDGRLEAEPLLAALAHGLAERPAPFSPTAAEQARIVSTALVRPGRSLRAVAVDAAGAMAAAARVVRLRGAVPLRS